MALKKFVLNITRQRDVQHFIKYCIVGGIIFCIHTALLWFFKRRLNIVNYYAIPLAFIIATVCHFLLNNFFTFIHSKSDYRKRITGYIFVVISNFIIFNIVSNIALSLIVDNVLIATMVSTGCTFLFGFCILHFKIYGQSTEQEE